MRVGALCKLYLSVRGCGLIFELDLKDHDVHESWILIDILRRRGFHPLWVSLGKLVLISMQVKLSTTH
jgi:hypothetical protein